MNKIILNYILKNYLKTVLIFISIFFCFGIIFNLFDELEFFKNIDVNLITPIILTGMFIPSMIIKALPFIFFLSSMWFMVKIRNNKDLLTLKVFGYSNFKIFFIVAFTAFIFGWFVLFFVSPITSSMYKYYEKTKSNYSRDVEHLVNFNRNGLWIKESIGSKQRIIAASKTEGVNLINVTIYHLDEKSKLIEKISFKKVNIKNNEWLIYNPSFFFPDNKNNVEKKDIYKLISNYNYEKINNLFKNFDTRSFIELTLNYNKLLDYGYNERLLDQNLHTLLTIPFFIFVMTALASILTLNTLKRSDNFKFIIIGIVVSVLVFYFKDFSLALGQTDRIPLIVSVWVPVIVLSLFAFIGVIQINEK